MAKFKSVVAGEWEQPKMRSYKLACCDCGLVHTVDFRIFKGHVQLRAWRNNRSTAAMRRWMENKLVPVAGAGRDGKS